MATYIRLAPLFRAGSFHGLDGLTDAHVHPAKPAAVVNCFNLEDYAIEREVEFVPEKFSLDVKLSYQFKGVRAREQRGGLHAAFLRAGARPRTC